MVDRFGADILQPDGTLDRAAVAAIVFNDPEALAHGILGVSNRLCTIYIDELNDDPEKVADLVVSFCRNGFAGRVD